MAVGKTEPASAVVVACWQIINPGVRIVRADDNEPIVDAVRVLVHEHPQVRRGRPANIAHLIVLEAIWRIWPGGDGGVAIPITDAITIHRVASHSRQLPAGLRDGVNVSGTLINADIPADVTAQFAVHQERDVGVVGVVGRETEPAADPAAVDATTGKGLVL